MRLLESGQVYHFFVCNAAAPNISKKPGKALRGSGGGAFRNYP